jgi:hypothetical protein
MSELPNHIARYIAQQDARRSGRSPRPDHDMAGNLIRNPDGSPFEGPTPEQEKQAKKSGDYAYAKATGTLGQWYAGYDPEHTPAKFLPSKGGRER